jgi:hypothetical protein
MTIHRADLANLVNEAALLAGRASKLEVGKEEFSRAVERSIAVSSSCHCLAVIIRSTWGSLDFLSQIVFLEGVTRVTVCGYLGFGVT